MQSENPQKKANEIYDLIEKFGGYGFNKSHSAAYSLIVYWTAFFKANYPLEFFAAIMSVEVSNLDRFQVFVNEAKKNNIDLLLPDVNICNRDFEVVKNEKEKENKKEREIKEIKKIEEIEERRERERENKKEEDKEEKLENEEKQYRKENERCGSIRFGFCGIKGIGEMLFQNLSEELKSRKFDSYEDFSMRMKDNEMTEKQLKILIFSGALDKFGKSRKEMLDLVKDFELFDADMEVKVIFPKISDSKDSEDEKIKFSQIELLEKEKKYLGIYVSKHPLDLKKVLINIISHDKIKNISKKNLKTLRIIGMIRNLNIFNTKKGENMAKFELEDFDGNIEIICFQNKYANFKNEIKENEIVILEGNVNFEDEKYNIFLENICKLENLEKRQDLKLFIKIDEDTIKKSQEIKKLILKYQGKNKVIQVLQKNQENQEIKKIKKNNKKNEFKISKYSINLSLNFLRRLVKLIGFEKLKIR